MVYSSKPIDAGSMDRSSIIVTYYERFRMNDTLFLMWIDHLQLWRIARSSLLFSRYRTSLIFFFFLFYFIYIYIYITLTNSDMFDCEYIYTCVYIYILHNNNNNNNYFLCNNRKNAYASLEKRMLSSHK